MRSTSPKLKPLASNASICRSTLFRSKQAQLRPTSVTQIRLRGSPVERQPSSGQTCLFWFSRRPCSSAAQKSPQLPLLQSDRCTLHCVTARIVFPNWLLWFFSQGTPWLLCTVRACEWTYQKGAEQGHCREKLDTLICLLCNVETQPTSRLLALWHTQPHVEHYARSFPH